MKLAFLVVIIDIGNRMAEVNKMSIAVVGEQ
jgi:hypothetical protein